MAAQRKLTPEQEDEVVNSYDAGTKVSVICDEYGISSRTVRAIVRRHGRELRPVGRPRTEDR